MSCFFKIQHFQTYFGQALQVDKNCLFNQKGKPSRKLFIAVSSFPNFTNILPVLSFLKVFGTSSNIQLCLSNMYL